MFFFRARAHIRKTECLSVRIFTVLLDQRRLQQLYIFFGFMYVALGINSGAHLTPPADWFALLF